MTLQSPLTGESLELIDGDADAIHCHALELIRSSEAMDRAANRLEDISNGTSDLTSEAITKVRESAEEVFPDLRKAAIRYNGTGEALKNYSFALASVQGAFAQCTAQGGVDTYALLSTLIEDIQEANTAAESKRNLEDEAQGLVREHDGFLGMGEGTDEQKEEAAEGLKDAQTARQNAEDELKELWGKFDARVSYWEDAYDEAVGKIEDAFEAAGNDDTTMQLIGDILNYVALGAAILAIFVAGPFALVLGAIALVASVIVLGMEIYKMAVGDGSWSDLAFAIIGLVPFGRVFGKVFSSVGKGSKGFFKALKTTRTSSSKGIVRSSVKPVGRRPRMTRVKGNGPRRQQIRRQNDVKKQKFRDAHKQRKDAYMDGFEESFTKNKFKMYVTYALDGGAARQRALAEYVKKNPRQVSNLAEQWADDMSVIAKREEFGQWMISMGLFGLQNKINADKG